MNVLDDTAMKPKAKYSVNITESRKQISLSLHYNAGNRFLYANIVKFHQFKAKDSEIKPQQLYLGNISKDFTVDDIKNLN